MLILIDITPGDPARIIAGSTATEEQYAKIRRTWGLTIRFQRGTRGLYGIRCKVISVSRLSKKRSVAGYDAAVSVYVNDLRSEPLFFDPDRDPAWRLRCDESIYMEGQCGDSDLAVLCLNAGFLVCAADGSVFCSKSQDSAMAGVDKWQGWIMPVVSLRWGTPPSSQDR